MADNPSLLLRTEQAARPTPRHLYQKKSRRRLSEALNELHGPPGSRGATAAHGRLGDDVARHGARLADARACTPLNVMGSEQERHASVENLRRMQPRLAQPWPSSDAPAVQAPRHDSPPPPWADVQTVRAPRTQAWPPGRARTDPACASADEVVRGGSRMCHHYRVAVRAANTPDSTSGHADFHCAATRRLAKHDAPAAAVRRRPSLREVGSRIPGASASQTASGRQAMAAGSTTNCPFDVGRTAKPSRSTRAPSAVPARSRW